MQLGKNETEKHNAFLLAEHKNRFEFTTNGLAASTDILQKLIDFQVAIPSWAQEAHASEDFPGEVNPEAWKKKLKTLACCMPLTNQVAPYRCIYPGIFQKMPRQ